jgi:hypothetical protein
MTSTIISPLIFIFIFIALENLGKKINKYFLRDDNRAYINLVYGVSLLSLFVLVLASLNLFNTKVIIIFLVFVSFIELFNHNFYKKFFKFCIYNFFISFFIILIFFSTIKSMHYSYGDDLSGYFYTISKYINGRDTIKSNLHENFREYHISSLQLINAIFVYLSDFYSTNFFDRFFGFLITILIVNHIAGDNKKIKFFLILLSILTIISVNETASGKIIVIPLSLLLLLKLEEFFNTNDENKILQIFVISLTLFVLKPISIISLTNILFLIILSYKICNGKIDLKKLFKNFFFIFFLIIPYLFYNYKINFSYLPTILSDSKYYYTNNIYFTQIYAEINGKENVLDYYFNIHNCLILFLAFLNFIFIKKKKIFNFFIFISLILFQFLICINLYPDSYNQLRYALPFYQSLFIYLFLSNIEYFKKENLKKYYIIFFISLFLATRINLNITINSKLIFNDFLLYFEKQSTSNLKSQKSFEYKFIYDYDYENNLNSILKNIDKNDNNLLLISRPYLINKYFFNLKNLTYVEQGSGFVLSDINYPLNGSIDEKKNFFNKKLIKFIVFEKKIRKNLDITIFKDYAKKSHIGSVAQKLFYYDLLNTIDKINKIKIIENNDFIIWKLI